MIATLVQLIAQHSLGFIAAAVVLCLAAAWLLAVLIDWLENDNVDSSRLWLGAVAVVAGLGVWTTHFIAMLGYRTDILFSYDPFITALSALVAVLLVGAPLALSTLTENRAKKGLLGFCSGLGIGAMHFIGMQALGGCTMMLATGVELLSFLIGGCCMALARGLPARFTSRRTACLLFAAAVCGTHFTAISGVEITAIVEGAGSQVGKVVLSVFTGAGAIALFSGALLALIVAKRFKMQVKSHSSILSTALHNMSNGLIFLDGNMQLKLFNDRFLEQFNLKGSALNIDMQSGQLLDIMAHSLGWDAARRGEISERMIEWIGKTGVSHSEYDLADGRVLAVECRPLPDGGAVVTFDDVTVERRTQNQVAFMAFHDPLTGLANRRALKGRMDQGFEPGLHFKLLLIDLDRFKAVNDTFGHGVGDGLLVEVAQRLRRIIGPTSFAARIGGDELAVLVDGDDAEALGLANAIVGDIARPFDIQGYVLGIGCSIGICGTDDAQDADSLMQRADIALYEAKRRGRGRAFRYQEGMLEKAAQRQLLETDLRSAVERGELELYYQPLFALAETRLIAFEALIRWNHPQRGQISPADFIPLAEESGSIVAIGQWVLREACRQVMQWDPSIHVAVNVSPVQFRSPLLLSHATRALAESGLPAGRLEIELTETAIVENGEQIAHTLAALRMLGIRVALDDFGTGYSSLAHFRDLPVDRIKIDRSFVNSAATDIHSMAVLKAVARIGKDVGIPTLGEGVETQEQLDLLREIGCDAAQGFFLGQPMPAAQASAFIDAALALRKAS
jgi:diguanylate cyclase (GGDEF)-like protein